jgi:SAM-dependent methyltransferase
VASRWALSVVNRLITTERRGLRRAIHAALGIPIVGSALEELHFRIIDRAIPIDESVADGYPVPPARLRYGVASTQGLVDVADFVATGRTHAAKLRAAALAALGVLPSPVLDLGCGVGRVLMHLDDSVVELYGCDVNDAAIRWCRAHLRGDFRQTAIKPPLPYDDGFFGLVYAISVFTHLPQELQRPWLAELRRLTRYEGVALITTHGEAATGMLTAGELRAFAAGQLVVRGALVAGSNRCNAYHPQAYLRDLSSGLFDVAAVEEAAIGNQDLVTLTPV